MRSLSKLNLPRIFDLQSSQAQKSEICFDIKRNSSILSKLYAQAYANKTGANAANGRESVCVWARKFYRFPVSMLQYETNCHGCR